MKSPLFALMALLSVSEAHADPIVFWAPDRVARGDVVLLYGGGLAQAERVLTWQVPNGDPGQPPGVASRGLGEGDGRASAPT